MAELDDDVCALLHNIASRLDSIEAKVDDILKNTDASASSETWAKEHTAKRYLSPKEAAEYLGVTPRQIRMLRERRVIPYVKMGHRTVLIKREDLDRACERYTVMSVIDRKRG